MNATCKSLAAPLLDLVKRAFVDFPHVVVASLFENELKSISLAILRELPEPRNRSTEAGLWHNSGLVYRPLAPTYFVLGLHFVCLLRPRNLADSGEPQKHTLKRHYALLGQALCRNQRTTVSFVC